MDGGLSRIIMQLKVPSQQISYQPIDVVGSSTFGLNPKILSGRTFNMIISDDWLVNYSGYRKEIIPTGQEKGQGRGIFPSIKSGALISVINNFVYSITIFSTNLSGKKKYSVKKIGEIETVSGDVFISENNIGQIAISDQSKLYIYNYLTDVFQEAILPDGVVPGNVTYQNGRFIVPDTKSAFWLLSAPGDGLNWFSGASGEPVRGAIQTKPDYAKVTIRFPGAGNLLLVMGENVSELWTDVGAALFPYQKNTSLNFDYGCVNAATVATSEKFVAWLGTNEQSEPVIMFSNGNDVQTISTDGINNKLQSIINPKKSVGFFVKIIGHICYQLTFYDNRDNYSLLYDFTTNKFFDVTDENQNYHIARHVAFFKDEYYFVSLNDGCIYVMSSDLSSYDYGNNSIFDIPKIRITSNFRLPNSKMFVVSSASLTIEQGNDINNMINNNSDIFMITEITEDEMITEDNELMIMESDTNIHETYFPRVSLSISRDGGVSFGSSSSVTLNKLGNRKNRMEWLKLGASNDIVFQFRFHLQAPLNVFQGIMGIRQ
jgi:hypothetical protein